MDAQLISIILGILLSISELLPYFPKVAANGIVQLVVDFLKKLVASKK